jgi:biopolymer transport protein ExbD
MRLSKHRRGATVRVDMTPMIDVTFQLLIFFMTVTQVSEISKERLELPKQKGSADQAPAELIINVTHLGEVIVQGETLSMGQVAGLLAEQLVQVGGDPGRMRVVLRIDERGTSAAPNELVEMLNKMQIRQVRIAVEASS